MEIEYN